MSPGMAARMTTWMAATMCLSMPMCRRPMLRAVRINGHRPAVLDSAFAHDAEVMRRAGRFEVDLPFDGSIVNPVERLLIFIRLEHDVFGQFHAAPNRYEHEDMQRISAEFQRQIVHAVQLLVVVLGDRGVDLHAHVKLTQGAKALHG